jgi:microcystin-dependent protein
VQYLRNLGSPFISVTSTSCAVLPDMRNKFPIGVDAGGANGSARVVGVGGGSHTISLVAANIPSHTHSGTTGAGGAHHHSITFKQGNDWGNGGNPTNSAVNGFMTVTNTTDESSHVHGISTLSSDPPVGTATTITITNPYVALYFCIKY